MSSKILWCDETWNPVRGCSRVSAGCDHCYAEMMAARFSNPGYWGEGVAKFVHGKPHWTGKIKLVPERLEQPLRWKKPRRIFVNSMSDLFHEAVPDEFIDRVFAVMALCPQHKFLVLTKRAERMAEYVARLGRSIKPLENIAREMGYTFNFQGIGLLPWPLPNVQLGVSVEKPDHLDRVVQLLNTPAAFRFVSYEPALGPLNFRWFGGDRYRALDGRSTEYDALRRLDLIIAGGESGPGARPAHPEWFRSTRDQCAEAGVAFFFKQWGEWALSDRFEEIVASYPKTKKPTVYLNSAGEIDGAPDFKARFLSRVGKKAAGRLLDGRAHDDLGGEA